MKTLTMALFAEGTTDYRFLPIVIQRTVESILYDFRCPDVAVVEPILLKKITGLSDLDKICSAAETAYGMHLLFIHIDADRRDMRRARTERFEPAQMQVMQSTRMTCKDLVPIIPIKNIEAWLLADYNAFCSVVGTRATNEQLHIPSIPRLVETLPDPKSTYQDALRIAHMQRRKRTSYHPSDYYELLGREISLKNLRSVPAFEIFYKEIVQALTNTRFIIQ